METERKEGQGAFPHPTKESPVVSISGVVFIKTMELYLKHIGYEIPQGEWPVQYPLWDAVRNERLTKHQEIRVVVLKDAEVLVSLEVANAMRADGRTRFVETLASALRWYRKKRDYVSLLRDAKNGLSYLQVRDLTVDGMNPTGGSVRQGQERFKESWESFQAAWQVKVGEVTVDSQEKFHLTLSEFLDEYSKKSKLPFTDLLLARITNGGRENARYLLILAEDKRVFCKAFGEATLPQGKLDFFELLETILFYRWKSSLGAPRRR